MLSLESKFVFDFGLGGVKQVEAQVLDRVSFPVRWGVREEL